MKITELRKNNLADLKTNLLNYKKEALNLRFQRASGELTKISRIREVRKTIAKIMTVINELNMTKGIK
jgi:large subunit ribosomal protein L29